MGVIIVTSKNNLTSWKIYQNGVLGKFRRFALRTPSWKHVNFYGKYTFREIGDIIDLRRIISRLLTFGKVAS